MRPAMALSGALALAAALLAGLAGDAPRPAWLLRFFVGWCVLVPYWWWLEHRLFWPRDTAAQAEFIRLQGYSKKVWLGGCMALAAILLVRMAG